MIDNKTPRLALPLPDIDNYLEDDVVRLSDALSILDAKVATVGSDGKIPVDQIPAVAITDTFTVNTEAAMLALNAQPGDVAIRSDISKSFILMAAPATTLSNWKELLNDALVQLAQPDGYLKVGGLDKQYGNIANAREQWRRQLSDAGLNLVAGSFEEGATATAATDAVWHVAGGQCYTWGGALPKTVPTGSTPDSTGGVSVGSWNGVGARSTLSVLIQPDGASKSYSKNAPVSLLLRRNIFEYMTEADRNTISATVGVEVVVDYALQAAIDDGVMGLYFPPVPGIYVFGQSLVTLPIGFSFEGKSRRTYTASSNASFNNVGTVLRLFNGATSIFKLTSRHTFRSVVFDGRDKSVPFMRGDDQTQWCRFYDCGIHRWSIGIGSSSPNGYSATLIVSGGTISSNTIGVKNVIDSLFLGATINANDTDGVQLLTGANNNAFIGVRNEWNNGDNYYGYGCKRILIQGELIDRAGKRAVAAVGGAQFTLSGVAVQRSGRLATEGTAEDAHYYIEGDTSSIIETAVHTTTGANDDGSGRQSPSYILATGGSSSDGKIFIASASNLSGYTGSSWLRSGLVKGLSVIGCTGVEDVKNFGFRRISDGVQYLGDTVSALSLSGAGNTATLTFKTTSQDFPRYSSELLVRNLEIRARNNTSTGSVAYYSVNLIISREQYAANIAVDTASVRTFATLSGGTWGIASASPTGVSLAFAISEDGTTLTVTLTAIDSASRIINARLRA